MLPTLQPILVLSHLIFYDLPSVNPDPLGHYRANMRLCLQELVERLYACLAPLSPIQCVVLTPLLLARFVNLSLGFRHRVDYQSIDGLACRSLCCACLSRLVHWSTTLAAVSNTTRIRRLPIGSDYNTPVAYPTECSE